MIKKKISELPECTSFKGLWTIGVDIFNKSVKVSLEYIQSVVEGMKAATKDATDVTDAASKSAQSAINAAQKAQEATTAANTATTNASNATAAAIEAKEDCEEVIAAAAELEPLNLVPTAMTVEYPSRLLVGNMAENFIRATLTPASVKPNVLFLGDDKAVSVTPDGRRNQHHPCHPDLQRSPLQDDSDQGLEAYGQVGNTLVDPPHGKR